MQNCELHPRTSKLDITQGSMASQTAEAVYSTFLGFTVYLNDYMGYVGQEDLLNVKFAKDFTAR